MKQEEINECNRIIAELMDAEWVQDDYGDYGYKFKTLPEGRVWPLYNVKGLLYHTSWDWLMPVVEKCNELCKATGYPDDLELSHLRVMTADIITTYQAVIEFIKWHNSIKP